MFKAAASHFRSSAKSVIIIIIIITRILLECRTANSFENTEQGRNSATRTQQCGSQDRHLAKRYGFKWRLKADIVEESETKDGNAFQTSPLTPVIARANILAANSFKKAPSWRYFAKSGDNHEWSLAWSSSRAFSVGHRRSEWTATMTKRR